MAHCKHLVWFKMINDAEGDYACMMGRKTSCEKCMDDSIPCELREIIGLRMKGNNGFYRAKCPKCGEIKK